MIQYCASPFVDVACKPLVFRYTGGASETAEAEIGVSINVGGQPPLGGIFSSVMPLHASNGWALAGERLRSPVPTFRYANPVKCPPTSIGVGVRASKSNVGGRNG